MLQRTGKGGEMRRMGKNSHWHVGPDLEKVGLFGSFVWNSRGRIQVKTEAHHVLRFNHWKSNKRAKTQPERLMKSLKSNKNTSSITESKAFFFRLLSPSVSFQSREAFVDCTNEPVIGLLSFPWKKVKTQILRCTECTSHCQSVAQLNTLWLNL